MEEQRQARALVLVAFFALGGCAEVAAEFPGASARCVAEGVTISRPLPGGPISKSAGCIETAPYPGMKRPGR